MKALVVALALLASLFFPFTNVFAVDNNSGSNGSEFSTSYDVTYDVSTEGTTEVTQKIKLKNLTSQYYVSNFTLTVGSTSLTDVIATDAEGPIEAKVQTENSKTSINLKFNQQIVGINKTQTLTLKFKSKDFAQQIGKVWEVNLPKIPKGNIENYNLSLSVPASFGDPTSIFPIPKSQTQNLDRIYFNFIKDQLINSGISVNFGTTQIFNFDLKYVLQNNSFFPVVTSVTLPPDTNYQQISINKIEPAPLNVTVDEDGNYLAWYRLGKGKKQEITVTGTSKLSIYPSQNLLSLTDSQKLVLIKNDKYWEKDNPTVIATLNEIFKGDHPRTTKEKAQLIYQYVVGTLKYDSNRLTGSNIERLGAVTVLNNPTNAICMEFTDLFIALSRAAGIPARELDGFAYSLNPQLRPSSLSKLLHAWPEYYDEGKGWVMVDPTWENTSGGVDYFNKFDLNHLVLSIKGQSSQGPSTSDDVTVSLSQEDFLPTNELRVEINIPDQIWSGLPSSGSIKITNKGNSVFPKSSLKINSHEIKILGSDQINLGPIPPFGNSIYQMNLRTPSILKTTEEEIEVDINGQKFAKRVEVKPFFLFQNFPYTLIIIGSIILLFYSTVLGIHIYKRRLQKGSK